MDVDSGPVIPFLGVSAGSSGIVFIGAAAFADHELFYALLTALDFTVFPQVNNGQLRYYASNHGGERHFCTRSCKTRYGIDQRHDKMKVWLSQD